MSAKRKVPHSQQRTSRSLALATAITLIASGGFLMSTPVNAEEVGAPPAAALPAPSAEVAPSLGESPAPAPSDSAPSDSAPADLAANAQAISVHVPATTTVGQVVTVVASATSGLQVTLTTTGPCAFTDGSTGALLASAAGTCAITAAQAGDERWLPADPVTASVAVSASAVTLQVGEQAPEAGATTQFVVDRAQALTISVKVAGVNGTTPTPTGTVTASMVAVDGGPCLNCGPVQLQLDATGASSVTLDSALTGGLETGEYRTTFRYDGDLAFLPSQAAHPIVRIIESNAALPGTAPIVVSIGDSYISGEGGRWAGNALNSASAKYTDTGRSAYLDAGSTETIANCHRSASAEIHIGQAGAPVASVNLACSGATTATQPVTATGGFKPGIDFFDYTDPSGTQFRGQALMLRSLATANPDRVKMVVLSIGGNDFGFADIVKACVQTFMLSGTPCYRQPGVAGLVSERNATMQLANVQRAIANVNDAMTGAGYAPDEWRLVVQNYPSPVPADKSQVRYTQSILRQLVGGCGMYDSDIAWANATALSTINSTVSKAVETAGMSNIGLLDLSHAFDGKRLCEKGVDVVGTWYPVKKWTQSDAANRSEWVTAIRVQSLIGGTEYQTQESLHPNYWGQRAYQDCLSKVWNAGSVRAGACTPANNATGLPRMNLT